MSTAQRHTTVLCILDGWGLRDEPANNAIALGETPTYDRWMATRPHAEIDTSGEHVGLPAGQMGNSEVGHMNIGAGRVVWQDLPRIDAAIADGAIRDLAALKDFAAALKASGGTCHLMGLVSPGGVHSHQDHMVELARMLAAAGVPVAVHAFLDGRDTPPQSAAEFIERFEADLVAVKGARIATVCGRYFAMDRDKRWDRVEKAYAALVDATGAAAETAAAAIARAYEAGETDEFVSPAVIAGYAGMADGDGVLMANFRADRAREILAALLDPAFDGFERLRRVQFAAALGMVEYSTHLSQFHAVLFPPVPLANTLGETVSRHELRQLRIAETEKYAHVTFFLNGGREIEFEGEDRALVPSPKVATYDLAPEMSAGEVTNKLVAAIASGDYDLIVVNYANPDMVGHTGVMEAALKAVATIDDCLARLETAVQEAGAVMLVTADHGNIEQMVDSQTHGPHTAHTTFRVPLVLVDSGVAGEAVHLKNGRLADIAPTVLSLMGLPNPADMTGESLVEGATVRINAAAAAE